MLKSDPKYMFTKDGICINSQTGRIIKKTVCGGSIGYCIGGKFRSVLSLRKELIKIEKIECPF